MAKTNIIIAYETLKNRILTGSYRPGEMLTEFQLASDLEMSRTPIRQALQMLAKDNLIEMLPHRGVFVKHMSLQEIQELFEARFAIEKFALERFIQKGPLQKDIDILKTLVCQQEEQEEDPIQFIEIDHQFHLFPIEQIDNQLLVNMLDHLRDQILLIGVKTLANPATFDETLIEHRQMIEAIERADSDRAIATLKEHIDNSRKRILLL